MKKILLLSSALLLLFSGIAYAANGEYNGTHILTTVPAEGGFSGGPLLNEKGEVVGVLTEIILELNDAVAISIDDVIEAYRNSI